MTDRERLSNALNEITRQSVLLLDHDDRTLRANCEMALLVSAWGQVSSDSRHGFLQFAILQATPEDRAALTRWMLAEGFTR